MKGAIRHRELSFWFLSNLAHNSVKDALKIAKNDGLIKRMLETIELRKDPKITMEACHALMTVFE